MWTEKAETGIMVMILNTRWIHQQRYDDTRDIIIPECRFLSFPSFHDIRWCNRSSRSDSRVLPILERKHMRHTWRILSRLHDFYPFSDCLDVRLSATLSLSLFQPVSSRRATVIKTRLEWARMLLVMSLQFVRPLPSAFLVFYEFLFSQLEKQKHHQ